MRNDDVPSLCSAHQQTEYCFAQELVAWMMQRDRDNKAEQLREI